MTITVVASTGQGVINGGAGTMTFSTVNDGDICVVANALTRTGTAGTVTSSGGTSYTQIFTANGATNLVLQVWMRRLSSFETLCTSSASGNAQDGDSFVATVIRGVPITTQSESSAGSNAGSANPNSPAVTIGSTSAIVLSIAAQLANNTVSAIPTGFSSAFNVGVSDTRSSHLAVSSIIASCTQTSLDPAAYTFSASAEWLAVSIAFSDSGSVYFPMPPPFRDPPDSPYEMISYGETDARPTVAASS